jgi:membrane-associated protein
LIDLIRRLLHTLTDVEGMIRWGGYVGLAAIIFAETGLMVGFFLPGDSLLVAAGLFAARGTLNLFVLWVLLIPMAVLGNSTGYAIGRRLGKALFSRRSSRLFNHRHLVRTQLFYEQHGGKAVSFAQFLPIFRTFTPVVAGIATMRYRRFVAFNVLGAISWVISMTVVGFALGRTFPQVAKRIELVMLIVIAISFIPAAISGWRARRATLRSRSAFLAAMSALVERLGSFAWDGSPRDLDRLAAELPAPHGSRAVEGPSPAVEMVAAQSPPLAELSDAAGEVAGWEMEERYAQARAALCAQYGEPREDETPGSAPSGPRSMPTRRATWPVPRGTVTLQQRCDPDRHRLSVRVEPAA